MHCFCAQTARAVNIAFAQRGCSSDCQTFTDVDMSWLCCTTSLCNMTPPRAPTTYLVHLAVLTLAYLMA